MSWRLKETIRGHMGITYGRKNEQVTVISDHTNVKIVEALESKKRFTARNDQLEEFFDKNEAPVEPDEIKEKIIQTRKPPTKKIEVPKEQTQLF